jgi:hypothetical protein
MSLAQKRVVRSRRWLLYFGLVLAVCALTAPFARAESPAVTDQTSHNFLQVDGKPIFVVGAYALPKGHTLEQGKAMGFNLVCTPADETAWDNAQKAGLRVWHSFGGDLDFASGDAQQKRAKIQTVARRFKDHPALLYWESMDEPAWTDKDPARARATAEGLTEGYRFLKSLDPNHPVYLNHAPRNTVETLRRYNTAADILCADIYPVLPRGIQTMYGLTEDCRHGDLPNQTPSCIGQYADKMRAVAGPGQSVFLVLQGFAWEGLRDKDQDPTKVLYPTYAQSRFMAYHAIIHGVDGLLYWGLAYVPGDQPFVKDLGRVLNELRDLSPALVGPTIPCKPTIRYHERGSTIAQGIETLAKRDGQTAYLIAANTSIDPAAADFASLPSEFAKAKKLDVLGENRSVPLKDGSFFDEFEGLGTHVYRTAIEQK